MTSLEGLESLATVRELRIAGNEGLTSLRGLEVLSLISDGLTIAADATLRDLTGMPACNRSMEVWQSTATRP